MNLPVCYLRKGSQPFYPLAVSADKVLCYYFLSGKQFWNPIRLLDDKSKKKYERYKFILEEQENIWE